MRPALRKATVLIGSLGAVAAMTLGVTAASAAGAEPARVTAGVHSVARPVTTNPSAAAVRVAFARLGVGFGSAVLVTNSGDGTGRLFVVDKVGRVFSWRPGSRPILYLDLRSRVRSSGDEQGMLGIAFYPDFKRVPLVFITYTRSDNALQVSRFLLSSYLQPAINPRTEYPLFTIAHPYPNHNGGMLAFGKDGYLFVSTGDGGGEGDPLGLALKGASPLGKILRVDASRWCGGHPYCVPTTNPFAHIRGADGRIWDFGLRNPWRFSVDPVTGALWIGDVGQNRWEEIDVDAAGVSALDYGWSCMEGRFVYNSARCGRGGHYVLPYLAYSHYGGSRAVIGGVVYRGGLYAPVLGHDYLFGDYVTGQIFTLTTSGVVRASLVGSLPGVTSIGTDSQGEVWATTLAGGVYRLTAS